MTITLPETHVAVENGRITEDLPCTCGYNLRTLEYNGRCPECGEEVFEAIHRKRFEQLEIRHAQEVGRWALRVYLSAWTLCAAGAVGRNNPSLAPAGVLVIVVGLAGLAFVAALIVGWGHLLAVYGLLARKMYRDASDLAWRLLLNPVCGLIVYQLVL